MYRSEIICFFDVNGVMDFIHNIDDDNQLRNVKSIINDVFSMVLECTNNLEKYNLAIMKIDDGATN